jgi:hypothetical protein
MSLVFLEYFFMFDPDDTWQHVHQFEQEFGQFLDERGMEANIIDGVGEKAGKRVLFINKKDGIVEKMVPNKASTSKKRLKTMSRKREGGKFVNKRK